VLAWFDVKTDASRLTKNTNLDGGLVDSGSSKRCGTVSGDHDERDSGVMRFQHTGVKIRDGRTRGGEDRDRSLRFNGDTECKERCSAFVNDDVKIDQLPVGEGGGHECQRLRTSAG
jgi:hypothetical protein